VEPVVKESVTAGVGTVMHWSDDIIEITVLEGSRIDVEGMCALLRAQKEMTPAIASVLVDARGTVSVSRKALEQAANNPVNDQTAATALLVESPVSTLIGNFFIRFARPPYPARVFRDRDEARRWLLEKLAERRG
jgi:hypothetical protein